MRGLFRGGAETVRCVRRMGGGVVLCGYKLTDMTADDLALSLEDVARVAVVARAPRLDLCQFSGLTRICAPFSPDQLVQTLARMCQEADARLFALEQSRRLLVERAKARLMEQTQMDEPRAHRYLQRLSMEKQIPLWAAARTLLDNPDLPPAAADPVRS